MLEPIRITGGHLDFNGVCWVPAGGIHRLVFCPLSGAAASRLDGLVDSGETRVDLATSYGLRAGSTVSAVAEIEGPALGMRHAR